MIPHEGLTASIGGMVAAVVSVATGLVATVIATAADPAAAGDIGLAGIGVGGSAVVGYAVHRILGVVERLAEHGVRAVELQARTLDAIERLAAAQPGADAGRVALAARRYQREAASVRPAGVHPELAKASRELDEAIDPGGR